MKGAIYRTVSDADTLMPHVPLPGANRGVLAPMTGMCQPAVPSAPKRLLRKKPIAVLPNFVKPTTQPNDPMSAEGSYNRGRGTYETAAIGAIIMLAVGAAIIWGRATR